jgi:hypothetical protein
VQERSFSADLVVDELAQPVVRKIIAQLRPSDIQQPQLTQPSESVVQSSGGLPPRCPQQLIIESRPITAARWSTRSSVGLKRASRCRKSAVIPWAANDLSRSIFGQTHLPSAATVTIFLWNSSCSSMVTKSGLPSLSR